MDVELAGSTERADAVLDLRNLGIIAHFDRQQYGCYRAHLECEHDKYGRWHGRQRRRLLRPEPTPVFMGVRRVQRGTVYMVPTARQRVRHLRVLAQLSMLQKRGPAIQQLPSSATTLVVVLGQTMVAILRRTRRVELTVPIAPSRVLRTRAMRYTVPTRQRLEPITVCMAQMRHPQAMAVTSRIPVAVLLSMQAQHPVTPSSQALAASGLGQRRLQKCCKFMAI